MSLRFTYDRYGNMTCSPDAYTNGYCSPNSFSTSTNRLTVINGSVTPTYDASGNLTSDGTNAYGWDAEGRLIRTTTGSDTYTYAYNSLDQLVIAQKESGRAVSYYEYVYDPSGNVIQVRNESAVQSSPKPDSGYSGFSLDSLPSPFAIYNEAASGSFYPDPLDALGSTTSVGMGYALFYPWGKAWDVCTLYGNSYPQFAGFLSACVCTDWIPSPCGAYNAAQGRWMSPTSAEPDFSNPQSLNRYTYAENNPTSPSDPVATVNPPGKGEKVSITYTDPSISGYQQDVINAMLNRLLDTLPSDPTCLAFLNNTKLKLNIVDSIRTLLENGALGHANVFSNGDPLNIAAVAHLVPGQAITVNNQGAFFNQTVGNNSLSVAGLPGGSSAAQALILLHEFGHVHDVLEHDLGDPATGRRNNEAIAKNCKNTIKACSKKKK